MWAALSDWRGCGYLLSARAVDKLFTVYSANKINLVPLTVVLGLTLHRVQGIVAGIATLATAHVYVMADLTMLTTLLQLLQVNVHMVWVEL